MKEINIDSMKYRKSTHLAGVDVEAIIAEKKNCILTIKECFYDTNVEVSGNKTNGYFIDFVEDVKPMCVNSGNRKVISDIVKSLKNCTSTESRNIGLWAGNKIELIFDPTVKMLGKVVGGIKVVAPTKIEISDINALSIIAVSKTLIELQDNWAKLTPTEKNLATVLAKKEQLKTTLK
jgi:hypothetical protein